MGRGISSVAFPGRSGVNFEGGAGVVSEGEGEGRSLPRRGDVGRAPPQPSPKIKDSPSSIDLMRALRSATFFSTVNFSSSEVTRVTVSDDMVLQLLCERDIWRKKRSARHFQACRNGNLIATECRGRLKG